MNLVEEKQVIWINEGIRVQEAPFCLLCGNKGKILYKDLKDRFFNAPGIWTLLQCAKCYFVWLNPRPIPEDMGKLYGQYFTHSTERSVPRFAWIRRFIRDAILGAHMDYDHLVKGVWKKGFGKVLSWVIPLKERVELSVMNLPAKKGGRLLDVGCGNGIFLEKMRSLGWEVVGVEMDEKAVKIGRERFALDIYQGSIEEVDLPTESTDAITMHHVIEHVPDPIGALKVCLKILKPRGRLVLITPNILSLGHRLFKQATAHLDPPRHLYLFEPDTLRNCAEQAGFQILEIRTLARLANWMYLTSSCIRRFGGMPGGIPYKQNIVLRFGGMTFYVIQKLLCFINNNMGEEILLIGTK